MALQNVQKTYTSLSTDSEHLYEKCQHYKLTD